MDKKAFGKNVNKARKDLGITSEKLSELCNLRRSIFGLLSSVCAIPIRRSIPPEKELNFFLFTWDRPESCVF